MDPDEGSRHCSGGDRTAQNKTNNGTCALRNPQWDEQEQAFTNRNRALIQIASKLNSSSLYKFLLDRELKVRSLERERLLHQYADTKLSPEDEEEEEASHPQHHVPAIVHVDFNNDHTASADVVVRCGAHDTVGSEMSWYQCGEDVFFDASMEARINDVKEEELIPNGDVGAILAENSVLAGLMFECKLGFSTLFNLALYAWANMSVDEALHECLRHLPPTWQMPEHRMPFYPEPALVFVSVIKLFVGYILLSCTAASLWFAPKVLQECVQFDEHNASQLGEFSYQLRSRIRNNAMYSTFAYMLGQCVVYDALTFFNALAVTWVFGNDSVPKLTMILWEAMSLGVALFALTIQDVL
ncbi:hypothetical protein ACA910_009745 [Epithemia clementina (nom. ined.)]